MEDNTTNKVDMSAYALESAKKIGFGTDEAKFKEWEKDFIKKFYETIGLADIPDEFLNFSKFIEAYSGVLVKSVQNDLAIMNLTKRLAMFKLSENIQQTAPQAAPEPSADSENNGGVLPKFVPPTGESK